MAEAKIKIDLTDATKHLLDAIRTTMDQISALATGMFEALPVPYQRVLMALATIEAPPDVRLEFYHFHGPMIRVERHKKGGKGRLRHDFLRPSTDGTDRWYYSHPLDENPKMAESAQAALDALLSK